MSTFWSSWITILTLVNIAACYWLIKWTSKPKMGEATEGDVTGHSWDGLEELNNPMPRWWLWLFYLSMIFSLGYLVLYPGLGNFKGVLGWSQQGQWQEEVARADETYGPIFEKYAALDIPVLAEDSDAMAIGKRLYLNYCAQCHGSDAGGAAGFPSLSDDDWLYGSTPAQIKASILQGRVGVMPAFGSALGGPEKVKQVAIYVASLSGRDVDQAAAEQGAPLFAAMCGSCHMPDGTGNQALGAPNLTDKTWLYGGSIGAIQKSIVDGRSGEMPPHKDFLGTDKVHLLSGYIFSLSQK